MLEKIVVLLQQSVPPIYVTCISKKYSMKLRLLSRTWPNISKLERAVLILRPSMLIAAVVKRLAPEVASQSANLRRTKHCEDDNVAVRVGGFCSSGFTADSRHWLLSISNDSSYLHRLLWAQKKIKPSIVSRCIKARYPQNFVFLALTTSLSGDCLYNGHSEIMRNPCRNGLPTVTKSLAVYPRILTMHDTYGNFINQLLRDMHRFEKDHS